jgi:hypothetical protein
MGVCWKTFAFGPAFSATFIAISFGAAGALHTGRNATKVADKGRDEGSRPSLPSGCRNTG